MLRSRFLFISLISFGIISLCNIVFSATKSAVTIQNTQLTPHYYFPSERPATGKRIFIFDPNQHAWAVYNEQGERVRMGRASGGQTYCPDIHRGCRTVSGKFSIISKGGPGCISHKFPLKTHGGAKTPYCMHFHPKGYAIHGYHEVPNHNASHGCIRVTPADAKWLNLDFLKIGSTVIVLPYKHRG